MAQTADIAIIGGGVIGLGIAYELSQRSDASIVLFDKDGPGAGTTGRSAGVICRHEQGPLYIRLSLIGHQRIRDFERRYGLGFQPWGALNVVREPDPFPVRNETAELLGATRSGMYVQEELDREQLLARFPWLEPAGVVGGYFEPNIGFIDPYELVALYRRLLDEAPSIQVMYGNPVLDVERSGERVVSLATRRGRWAVGSVVNAGGPWGAKVAALAGTAIALTPQRIQVAIATTYDDGSPEIPLHGAPGMCVDGDGVWCRGEVGGGAIFGQHRDVTRRDQPTADPDFFDRRPDETFASEVEKVARTYYRLPRSAFLNGWTCVYGTTEDGFPIVSGDPNVSNLFHAVGMNGHGMTIHAGVARCMGRLLLDGSTQVDVSDVMPWPEVLDFSCLDVSRFERGELVPMRGHAAESAPPSAGRSPAP